MRFLLADKSHIPELVRMRLEYVECDDGYISNENREKMSEALPVYFEKHLGKDFMAFIAVEDDKVVATAFLLVIEKPSSPHFIHGKTGNVLNVYTQKAYQKQGIATKLMEMLIDYAKKECLDFIELKATEEGYPLYQKCGFTEEKQLYRNMKYIVH